MLLRFPATGHETRTACLWDARNFKATPQYKNQTLLLAGLRRTDFVAVREGRLAFRGWSLRQGVSPSPARPLTDADYRPDIEQKGVDMKIGLDIAWISLARVAGRICLVTGDSDFVPAMKFARRSGVQVFLLTLAHGVSPDLLDHADVLNEAPLTDFVP